MSVYITQNGSTNRFDSSESWTILAPIEMSIKRKIESIGTPLKDWNIQINFGIKTGCNEAFIISGEKKDALINEDPKSAEIIRPILRGRDIKRYGYEFADLWLINAHNGIKEKNIAPININLYPAIKRHLDQYYPDLEKRADKGETPYNLRNCAYMDDFSKQKMVWKRIGSVLKFSLDCNKTITLDSTCFATGDSIEYIVAILNTFIGNFMFKDSPKTGTGDLIVSVQAMEPIRIPMIPSERQKEFSDLLMQIMSTDETTEKYHEIEKKLNQKSFDLFNISSREADYITDYVLSHNRGKQD